MDPTVDSLPARNLVHLLSDVDVPAVKDDFARAGLLRKGGFLGGGGRSDNVGSVVLCAVGWSRSEYVA